MYAAELLMYIGIVWSLYFSAFVDLVVKNFKSPIENAKTKVEHIWLGPADSKLASEMAKCDANVRLPIR